MAGEYLSTGAASEGKIPIDHPLHVAIDAPSTCMDWYRDGSHVCGVDGFASHSNDPSRCLVDFRWYYNDELLSDGEKLRVGVGTGEHTLQL